MSKGLEFELDVRTVYETILNKIGKQRSGKIIVSDQDFRELFFGFGTEAEDTFWELRSNSHLDVILLQIEKESKGKIKLLSPKPTRREHNKHISFDDYRISFDLDKIVESKSKNKSTRLFLSTNGFGKLYNVINGKTSEFHFRSSTMKRDLLTILIQAKHKPVPSKDLMKALKLERHKDLTRLISQLRKALQKLDGIQPLDVLPEGVTTEGYKIGDGVEIKMER